MAKNIEDANLDAAIKAAAKEVGSPASVKTAKATVDSVEANAAKEYNALETKRKSLVNVYRSEDKVPVTISPFYAPYLGRVVRESVNGIIVDVPADGQTYKINKTHADNVQETYQIILNTLLVSYIYKRQGVLLSVFY